MDRIIDEDGEPRGPADQRLLGGWWKLHPEPPAIDPPLCAECRRPLALRMGKTPRANEQRRPFWGCTGYPVCRGAHAAGTPLGIPGNKATREARVRAHIAFGRIWEKQIMRRTEAYEWMGREFALPPEERHIGRFDEEMCDRLIRAVFVMFVERGLADPSDWPPE